jgi:hypothetical protein
MTLDYRQWAEKMSPVDYEVRAGARRRKRREQDSRVTAGGWIMLAFCVTLWLYLIVVILR